MEVLRTPDERFENLADWPHAPNYVDDLDGYEGVRVHYVDTGEGAEAGEGAKAGEAAKAGEGAFLLLHGQPTWGYLYRRMIPIFARAGRVVAPDWLGFGRSDKPAHEADVTFHMHRNMMLRLIERLSLERITLVVQDWGGLLGLTLPMEAPERYERLLVMNTALATGRSPGPGFQAWRDYANAHPDLDIARLMRRACPHLSEAEAAAYAAPYPDATYKAAVRRFPQMVMVEPDMEGVETSRRAVRWWREEWRGESFMAVGAQDPVLGPDVMERMRGVIRNCPEPMVLEEAGHFVQEWGERVAEAALERFGEGP